MGKLPDVRVRTVQLIMVNLVPTWFRLLSRVRGVAMPAAVVVIVVAVLGAVFCRSRAW